MAQSQTPPNTMIVVNSLPLKKKTKITFFFTRHLKYWLHFLHYFSSHVCAVVFITIFVASTPPMKAEAECLPSILVNEPKEEWRGDGFEAVRVCACTCTERQMCVCHSVPTAECSTLTLFSHPTRSGLSVTHCFTQFTICTCPPSSHLFVSHAVLHRPCFLSFLVASSVSFLFFSNLISIFSPQPSFCTGLSLIICFFPPSWNFHDSVEWCMSFLW